uniref:Uncharacterized protein n=1 Tax=Anguilla anguilla TaxID=7936 RepID=A0A0E9QUP6_ANGAN
MSDTETGARVEFPYPGAVIKISDLQCAPTARIGLCRRRGFKPEVTGTNPVRTDAPNELWFQSTIGAANKGRERR